MPRARDDVTSLALAAGAHGDALDDIRLAASEAVTNAVRHAYPDGGGYVHVTAAVTEGELWLLVADDGRGIRPRGTSPGLGLGLFLIACSADDLTVAECAGGGTEVRMRFALGAGHGPRHRRSRWSAVSAA